MKYCRGTLYKSQNVAKISLFSLKNMKQYVLSDQYGKLRSLGYGIYNKARAPRASS
jgi:hypothetical protein